MDISIKGDFRSDLLSLLLSLLFVVGFAGTLTTEVNTKSICCQFAFVVMLSLLLSPFFFKSAKTEGARRRFTRRSSAEHRNHAAQQVTKLGSMS